MHPQAQQKALVLRQQLSTYLNVLPTSLSLRTGPGGSSAPRLPPDLPSCVIMEGAEHVLVERTKGLPMEPRKAGQRMRNAQRVADC